MEAQIAGAASIGGPGPADPALCSSAAIAAMASAAGAGFGLTTLQIDVASQPVGSSDVVIRVRIDKRTKSIVFASVEAMSGQQMVFRAQGLLGRR